MAPPDYHQQGNNNDLMSTTTPVTILAPPTTEPAAQEGNVGANDGNDANIPVVYATVVPPEAAQQVTTVVPGTFAPAAATTTPEPLEATAHQPMDKFSMAAGNTPLVPMPLPVPVPVPVPANTQLTTTNTAAATPPTALTTMDPKALATTSPTALAMTAVQDADSMEVKQLVKQGFTKDAATTPASNAPYSLPSGLAQALATHTTLAFPQRIWIIDNSGSMQMNDGHRLLGSTSYYRLVDSTRWDEIRDCVNHHIEMASLLKAPTSFRLLNDPQVVNATQHFSVADAEDDPSMIKYQAENALSIMRLTRPRGVTPLTRHVYEIHQQVFDMAPQLNLNGQKVVIVIATDGLPSDDQGRSSEQEKRMFVDALRSLEGLPVWVVIRLCTDEDAVVDFYNNLDNQLELSLEVLDDFVGEAQEVYEHNNWLTYGLALHRCREMGFHDRLFDLMDERSLTRSEIRDFCMVLFGQDKFDGVPDPEMDWDGFVRFMEQVVKTEELQWNPVTKSMTPWINIRKLQRVGNPAGCSNWDDLADTINFLLKQLFPRK